MSWDLLIWPVLWVLPWLLRVLSDRRSGVRRVRGGQVTVDERSDGNQYLVRCNSCPLLCGC